MALGHFSYDLSYGGHVGLRVFKLLLGKCSYARWNYCCRKYGDGHLNQVSILENQKVMANLRFTSSYIWRPCWFSIFSGRWEYFTILFEILTDENVGINTKTKSLDSLIRKIFVIEWFHLISLLIRSITQNATDKKLCEILTVENVCIDIKTKYLESLSDLA